MSNASDPLQKSKINLETAEIPWTELQRFFAAGRAIVVSHELDLVEVAWQFAQDNSTQVSTWLTKGLVCRVSDQQALDWLASDSMVWAVVVKPWVLVQQHPGDA